MTYFAYLDEFGHIGPYVARQHPRHNDSPVFGLAGFVMPSEHLRGFGTWFFQRKCDLLAFEIERSGQHPALWEKKEASLYTAMNVTRYVELRKLTNRLFNTDRIARWLRFLCRDQEDRTPRPPQPEPALQPRPP